MRTRASEETSVIDRVDRIVPFGPKVYTDHPPFSYPEYRSTVKRAPTHDLVAIVQTLSELTGPAPGTGSPDRSGWSQVTAADADLTTNAGTGGEAIGSRTIVVGRVLDVTGNPVPHTQIEIWQANACGRYAHWRETAFPAPLDPNFIGAGRCITNEAGEYRFLTIRPGPYPWGNHPNAWRPAHIHISLFGSAWAARLVTQFYFEGDPLLALDPIFNSVPVHAQDRLIAKYAHDVTEENYALGYRFDIVLNGPAATPADSEDVVVVAGS
jgi:protocatechuate 3,4-dioxygenase, beta subunit